MAAAVVLIEASLYEYRCLLRLTIISIRCFEKRRDTNAAQRLVPGKAIANDPNHVPGLVGMSEEDSQRGGAAGWLAPQYKQEG